MFRILEKEHIKAFVVVPKEKSFGSYFAWQVDK